MWRICEWGKRYWRRSPCVGRNQSDSLSQWRWGSADSPPVRRFDGIWFDCQPASVWGTALDVKYPSFRGGKATKDLGAHFEVRQVQLIHQHRLVPFFVLVWQRPESGADWLWIPRLPPSSSLTRPTPPPGTKPHLLRPTSLPYCLEKPQLCPSRPPKARLSPLPVTQRYLLQSTAHQSKAPNPIRVDLGLPGISFSTAWGEARSRNGAQGLNGHLRDFVTI